MGKDQEEQSPGLVLLPAALQQASFVPEHRWHKTVHDQNSSTWRLNFSKWLSGGPSGRLQGPTIYFSCQPVIEGYIAFRRTTRIVIYVQAYSEQRLREATKGQYVLQEVCHRHIHWNLFNTGCKINKVCTKISKFLVWLMRLICSDLLDFMKN